MSELGKGPLVPLSVDWDKAREACEPQKKPKLWSDKIAVKAVPDPICSDPGCGGTCAAALIGLWCTLCGKRAYG